MTQSIAHRLKRAIIVMLLPLLLLGTGGYVLVPNIVDSMDKVVEEVADEMLPVVRLQLLIQEAQMPANDYLITAAVEERLSFETVSREIDESLELALAAPFEQAEKKQLLQYVQLWWSRARSLSNEILAIENPVGNLVGAQKMEQMDALLMQSTKALNRVHELVVAEIHEHRYQAHASQKKLKALIISLLVISIFLILLGITIVKRAVVSPVRRLNETVRRLRSGDLDARVLVDRDDEIGRMGEMLNSMAETLQRDQARLSHLASHDELTGLRNVREFWRLLDLEKERAVRYGHGFSLMMLDLDHFKQVNDTHGHLVGDEVLRQLGRCIGAICRPSDVTARFGGEEFAIILPETSGVAALALAERLRASIQELEIAAGPDIRLHVTVSIGLAAFPDDALEPGQLVAVADKHLYEAKHRGRNCVRCSWQADAMPVPTVAAD